MASWTRLGWDTTLWMAAYGPENCHIESNPPNLRCPNGNFDIFNIVKFSKQIKILFFILDI